MTEKENLNFYVCFFHRATFTIEDWKIGNLVKLLLQVWIQIRLHKGVEPIVFTYRAAKRKKIDTRIYHLGTISTSRQNWLDLGWCKEENMINVLLKTLDWPTPKIIHHSGKLDVYYLSWLKVSKKYVISIFFLIKTFFWLSRFLKYKNLVKLSLIKV